MVAEVGVVHVRRIVRIERLRRTHFAVGEAGRPGRRGSQHTRQQLLLLRQGFVLRQRFGLARQIGGVVHHHRRIAVGPGAQEEFLEFALGTIGGRAELQAVGEDFVDDAGGAIIDRETVGAGAEIDVIEAIGLARTVLIVHLCERLHRVLRFVVDDGDLPEGLLAVGQDVLIGSIRAFRLGEPAMIVAGEHGGDVAPDNFRIIAGTIGFRRHAQHRQALARAAGVGRVVIHDGVAVRRFASRGEGQIGLRDLAAVPLGAGGFDVHRTEQAQRELIGVETVEVGGGAVQQVGAFLRGVQDVGGFFAGSRDALRGIGIGGGVGPRVAAVVGHAAYQFHPRDMDGGRAGVRLQRIELRRGQQVLEGNFKAIAFVHPQHQRTRAPVGAQLHPSRTQFRSAVRRHNVAPQGIDFSARAHRAQTVDHDRLIQCDHVRPNGVGAFGRLRRHRRHERGQTKAANERGQPENGLTNPHGSLRNDQGATSLTRPSAGSTQNWPGTPPYASCC